MKIEQDGKYFDCLIVGGGLAGGLLLEALHHYHPKARVLLLEQGSVIGGNHTWCFHPSDVDSQNEEWLKRLISKTWSSYEVFFPKYNRQLESGYAAIRSADLHDRLLASYSSAILLNQQVKSMNLNSVTLGDGEVLHAACVIDARGWSNEVNAEVGYQKFVGLDVRLKKPHGLNHVRLKDVRVPQTDGYRFIYVLPWNERELLIEDTYYSNQSDLDVENIKSQILEYIQQEGWEVEEILRVEEGRLPLALEVSRNSYEGLKLGASSGIYQPVTGYTFPQTLERVGALAQNSRIDYKEWKKILTRYDEKYHQDANYLCLLNRMLFKAADPHKRYIVLERFYTLPAELIERFYRGQLHLKDKFRILWGKPPVSIWRALKVLIK